MVIKKPLTQKKILTATVPEEISVCWPIQSVAPLGFFAVAQLCPKITSAAAKKRSSEKLS